MAKFSEEELKPITTGASIHVDGKLVESQGQEQKFKQKNLKYMDLAMLMSILLQRRLEFLREKHTETSRTNTFGAVLRIRHTLSFRYPQVL